MSAGRKILLVDDNPLYLDFIQSKLPRAYFSSILTARDGLEAIRVARSACLDVVVSDIRMEKMGGYALCREIRKDPETSSLVIILYTAGDVTREIHEAAMAAGATHVMMASPVNVEPLVEKIRELLSDDEVSL